jgi:hypothetical protein
MVRHESIVPTLPELGQDRLELVTQ